MKVRLFTRALLVFITLLASLLSAQCMAACVSTASAHDCCDNQDAPPPLSCPGTGFVAGEFEHRQAILFAADLIEPLPIALVVSGRTASEHVVSPLNVDPPSISFTILRV